MSKRLIAVLFALTALFLTGCEGESDGVKAETNSGTANHNRLVEQQPAEEMQYSSTRETINFFTRTWGQRGKTAYVYLMNNEGKVVGYYVTEGPPVSMCTSIRPTYKVLDTAESTDLVVPAPGADGAYYSGNECNTYYAKDANTGAYLQFTAGMGINPLLYDQPLSPGIVGDAPNLGNVK